MKAVVFDIGNVLIQWDPVLAWVEDFGSREATEDFLDQVDFYARNLRGDGGETFADMSTEIADDADRERFAEYVDRYPLTVPQKVPGTWDILFKLKANGTPIHAITNWSAETWPEGMKVHPELGQVFDVTVVSGQEKMLKPEARIYELLCERAGLSPADCIFIDDSPKNVEGARAVGMDAIHFTDADALARALSERQML
ncbi:HAD family hydrolase [Cognatishimia activa]|uniref:HAD family hydrolase n=1 Tax=Cognatishimia activa TaxID=1715691 RepID=UPI0022314A68|nr:HAD family phosphatase [Cognatishimia activa]UZD89938.1 HAD family phosphatase [Cognatishimia activa]